MSALTHSLTTLWSRFRWEILVYLVLVALSCISNLTHPGWANALAPLQTLGLFWITFRILLSEAGFRTNGGWRTRPFNSQSIHLAQVLLILAVVVPPVLVRVFTLHHLFHPTFHQWTGPLKSSFVAAAIPWLLFVFCVKNFEFLLLRHLEGRARRAAWSVMIIILVPTFLFQAVAVSPFRSGSKGGTGQYPEKLSPGIQLQLPDATEFIGMWYESIMDREVPQARLLARFPLGGARPDRPPGFQILSLESSISDLRSRITLDLISLDPALLTRLEHAVPVIAYPDGSYGAAMTYQITTRTLDGISADLPRMIYEFEFTSPISLPENRNADPATLAPIELLFFTEDLNLPRIPIPLDNPRSGEDPILPPLTIPSPPTGESFQLAIRQLIDSLSAQYYDLPKIPSGSLPAEAITPILAYHPWSDHAWKIVIQPFLLKHATESHKAILLQRLAQDPRLADLFIKKGWSADALPILRQRAKDRLPLGVDALNLLARQSDSTLSFDIAALAIRLDRGVGSVAATIRQNHAFDWPAFVAAGWKIRKYGNYEREGWLYAHWSAELGDPTAFRRLAEEAASGKKWELEQLAGLIVGKHEDLIDYLRKNIDRMKFDPVTRKWGL